MNNRYQKGTTPKGVTRKSAASAKPKRAVGEQTNPSGRSRADFKKKGKQSSQVKGQFSDSKKASLLRETPVTPEFKQCRRIWWYCLGAASVLLVGSLALSSEQVQDLVGLEPGIASSVGIPMTFMAMVLVGYAWYIDLKKIRPMMRNFDATGKVEPVAAKSDKSKPSKDEKLDKGTDEKSEDKKLEASGKLSVSDKSKESDKKSKDAGKDKPSDKDKGKVASKGADKDKSKDQGKKSEAKETKDPDKKPEDKKPKDVDGKSDKEKESKKDTKGKGSSKDSDKKPADKKSEKNDKDKS